MVRICDYAGTIVGEYAYDAYGNCAVLIDEGGLASLNPFRYRGYYFDSETGLYYLNARYYDPRIGRFLSPDGLPYLDPSAAVGMNLYAYCQCDPVNKVDPTGHEAGWLDWLNVAGKIITGVLAVVTGVLVMASGVAGIGMLVVAGITIMAGALTVNNGVADAIGLATGYNYMLDGVFHGNSTAYAWFSGVIEAIAAVGAMICGGWLKANAPRISAYRNVGKYDFSNTISDANHMTRPWQNSTLLQKEVIKYGKMTKDATGWAFEAVGAFNGHGEVTWKLVVSVAKEVIWHWGIF